MRTIGLFIAVLFAWAAQAPATVSAQAPTVIPVQGYLTDSGGAPVNEEVSMLVSIYDRDSGGTPLYMESQMVMVDQGFFTAYVGDTTPVDLAIFRDNTSLFVGIRVGADAEMSPRLGLGTVPFAGYAEHAGNIGDMAAADVQRRVSGTCGAGEAISTVRADGMVDCVSVGGSGAGVAASTAGPNVTIATTDMMVASVSVTFPAAGRALVVAEAEFRGNNTNQYIFCTAREGATSIGNWDWEAGDTDSWYDQMQTHHLMRTVSAGDRTYNLLCRCNTGTTNMARAQLHVMYFPDSI